MEFLAPNAAAFVKNTIPASFDHSLGPAAPWADDVRSLSSFSWSAPFHFIDANGKPILHISFYATFLTFDVYLDDPKGGSCSVDEARDCGSKGCLCEISHLVKLC
jgi:hypothetical protein